MKLPFESHDPLWKAQFATIRLHLHRLLQELDPQIEHIGSTAVKGLSAKPIIDIQVGVRDEADLRKVPELLRDSNMVYYEKYNEYMPSRRFFILFKKSAKEMGTTNTVLSGQTIPEVLNDHTLRIAHIHVFVTGTHDYNRHLAFRDYLVSHPMVREAYRALKERLAEKDWKDGNQYNENKDAFLKEHEGKAIQWWHTQH